MNRSTQPLRIAFVITELEVGGAERCLMQLALRLDRRLFEPMVYSLAARPEAGRDELVSQLEVSGIPVHFIGAKSIWRLPATVGRLRRLLAEQSPHILQTFLFHANVVGALSAKGTGIEAICSGIRVADPRRWRHWVERKLENRVDRIVCVSQSVAKFSEQAGLPKEKLSVIANGLDPQNFPSPNRANLAEMGISAGRRVMTFVGRLDQQKGLDWLLEMAPRIFKALPDVDLLLVGEGPQRVELQSLAQRFEIADRVHFVGWQDNVPEILAASDLFVLPSRWEGMPNALLEAMASGLPVVAARADGVEELLGPQAEIQMVAFGDSERFIAAVTQLSADSAMAEQTGQANRLRASKCFSLARMVEAYQQLYLSLIK